MRGGPSVIDSGGDNAAHCSAGGVKRQAMTGRTFGSLIAHMDQAGKLDEVRESGYRADGAAPR
jgi:hypothetical protein